MWRTLGWNKGIRDIKELSIPILRAANAALAFNAHWSRDVEQHCGGEVLEYHGTIDNHIGTMKLGLQR